MDLEILENTSLAELTTLKIGGKAKFFAKAKNNRDVAEAFQFAKTYDLEVFVLGGGSNILIADEGFDGLVLQIAVKGISILEGKDETVFVSAGAGEDWDNFVKFCVKNNLQGLECLSGIPGFVGGTPVQNVGAYGQEVSETISGVKCFDRKNKTFIKLENSECKFAYRTSIFNTTKKNRYVVLEVIYKLKNGGSPKIVYADLQKYFDGKTPTLQEAREAVLEIRAKKSMVINERDANSKSAGSFFKNPIVSNEKFAKLNKTAANLNIIEKNGFVPNYKVDEKSVKIPAAWLIEKAGFEKGYEKGNVGLSTKHTLALINRGEATAQDILDLKNEIQMRVLEIFDIELKPEPIFIGFRALNSGTDKI